MYFICSNDLYSMVMSYTTQIASGAYHPPVLNIIGQKVAIELYCMRGQHVIGSLIFALFSYSSHSGIVGETYCGNTYATMYLRVQ